ncbi:hypothetical protein SESBI_03102 [Sesbania bispinosa]|nr:hypothetical protein SESBI_03102 [Sesbania bispinosa]
MDGHSSTSQVRVLSSSSSNPNYDWVLPEVLEKPSEYLSIQSINRFREEYDIGVGDESYPELLMEADGSPHFPLYWSDNLIRIRGLSESDLSEKAKVEVEFLKSLKKKNLSCSDIIEAEGDPSALERLLGQKRDKSASTSQNSQSHGPTNPTPSGTPPPPSPKRQRLEENSDNTTNPNTTIQLGSELNRPPSVERVPEKWWLYFREFESAENIDVTSIFDHRFQLADVIEGNLCKAADRARIQKVGLRNTATMAQSMAARTTFLAHGLGHGIDVLEKENFELKQKLKSFGNAENIIKELTQKISNLEVEAGRVTTLSEEVEAQKVKVIELETVNKTLTEEKTTMSSTISLLQEEKGKVQTAFDAARDAWKLEEKELKTDLALYHENDFNKAIEQVQFLYPDIDLSEVGMFKEIVNEALVETE